MAGYHLDDRCCWTAALDPDDGPRDLEPAWVRDSVVRLLVPVEVGKEITTFIRLECLPQHHGPAWAEGEVIATRSLPIEPALFLPVVLHLDFEPLQRAPRHVRGLRVLPHDPLIAPMHRLRPRLETVVG